MSRARRTPLEDAPSWDRNSVSKLPQWHAPTGFATCAGGWWWEQDSAVHAVSYTDTESTATCTGCCAEQATRRVSLFEPYVCREFSGSILRMRGTRSALRREVDRGTSRCPRCLGHGRIAAGHPRPDRASNSRASLQRLRCHVAAESNATEARVILLRWQRFDSGCFPIASQRQSVR